MDISIADLAYQKTEELERKIEILRHYLTNAIDDIQCLNQQILSELDSKLDSVYITELESMLENKVDADDFSTLQSLVDNKADSSDLSTLQTAVQNKADSQDVVILQSEMTNKLDKSSAVFNELDAVIKGHACGSNELDDIVFGEGVKYVPLPKNEIDFILNGYALSENSLDFLGYEEE